MVTMTRTVDRIVNSRFALSARIQFVSFLMRFRYMNIHRVNTHCLSPRNMDVPLNAIYTILSCAVIMDSVATTIVMANHGPFVLINSPIKIAVSTMKTLVYRMTMKLKALDEGVHSPLHSQMDSFVEGF